MDIDLEAILQIVGDQAKAIAIITGQLEALKKHSAKQAAELAELRKKNVPE